MVMSSCAPYNNLPTLGTMNDLSYQYDTKYVKIADNLKIAYIEKGTGPETIVLIHGLGSYSPAWNRNIDELSKQFRVMAIDLPGYGKSDKPVHSGRMSYYSSVVVQVLDALKLDKVILGGHSMGGQISMITALQYPDKVKKLILVDPAGFEKFHAGQRKWFKEIMTPNLVKLTTVEAIESNLATNFYRLPEEAKFMITDRIAMRHASDFDYYCWAVAKSVEGMVEEPVYNKLSDIKVPTLIFFGENDNLIPNRYLNPGFTKDIATDGASKIAGSKLIMVPKCGHFMMFEHPEVFNAEVIKFMNE